MKLNCLNKSCKINYNKYFKIKFKIKNIYINFYNNSKNMNTPKNELYVLYF